MFGPARLLIVASVLLSMTVTPAFPAHHEKGADAHPPVAAGYQGEVTETMEAGGYTYVRVKTSETVMWVAGPRTPVGSRTLRGEPTGSRTRSGPPTAGSSTSPGRATISICGSRSRMEGGPTR